MERSEELSMNQSFLQSLKDIVLSNLENEQFGAEDLAKEMGLSRSQIHRKLQKVNGKSITQFIREIRLDVAVDLLKKEVGTASEIAYKVGFSSPAYFTKCFHEHFGYTPGEAKYSISTSENSPDEDDSSDGTTIVPIDGSEKEAQRGNYRKLTTILFSNMCGYTAIMEEREKEAIHLLKRNRELHQSIIALHDGVLIKENGDIIVASFETPTDAVRCAQQMINAAKEEENLKLHIGIHLGEIHFIDGDIFGDGVHAASRLEQLAKPNQILVSDPIHKNIKNKHGIRSTFIEEKHLKNVDEPIRVYQVLCGDINYKISDIKPEKVKSKKPYSWLAGILVVSIAILFLWKYTPSKDVSNKLEKSIAVLPLKYLSEDQSKQYLADGVMDAITGHLSLIDSLIVRPRTSVEQYRDTHKTSKVIGEELGVSYLVEGSFLMIDDQVKLTLQLINAKDEAHLYFHEYNRDYSDIMSVQSEVAQTIAKEIEVIIAPEIQKVIEDEPTVDLTAYDYYLRGKDYGNRSLYKEDLEFAIQMFEKAVETDPNFVLAWVGLAATSRGMFWIGFGRSEEILKKTKEYLDRAKRLDANLLEVRFEEGCYYYQCERNYPKALNIFENLKKEYPKNDEVTAYIAAVYRRMGEFQKALEYRKNAISLNPRNWGHWLNIGNTYRVIHEYDDAEYCIEKAIELNPSFYGNYGVLLDMYINNGQLEKAKELLKNNHQIINYEGIIIERAFLEILEENYQSAISIIESIPTNEIKQQDALKLKQLELGLIYRLMANEEMAILNFNVAKTFFEDKILNSFDDSRPYRCLGLAYAGLGMKEQAIKAGNKALQLMNFTIDFHGGFETELDMVRILLMVGEYEDALTRLEFIIGHNGRITVEELKLNPFWNPVRKLEKFQSIINNPEYQVNLSGN